MFFGAKSVHKKTSDYIRQRKQLPGWEFFCYSDKRRIEAAVAVQISKISSPQIRDYQGKGNNKGKGNKGLNSDRNKKGINLVTPSYYVIRKRSFLKVYKMENPQPTYNNNGKQGISA